MGLLLALVLVSVVLAQISTNFDLSWHLLSGGGGSKSSANYWLDDTLGQWVGRSSSSTNYQIEPGFWYEMIPAPVVSGDGYEIDDTCSVANPIATDGTLQTHTFHDAGDQDWIKFTTEANKTYIIQTTNVGDQHDGVLFLHNICEAPALEAETNAFGQTVRLEWNSTSASTYYLMFRQHDPAIYGENTNYDVSVRVDDMPPSAPRSPRSAPADQALILQWRHSSELDVVGYKICWGPTSGECAGVEDVAGGDTTYYELPNLVNGTRYYIRIRAVDFSNNESPWSSEISNVPAPPPDTTTPSVTVKQPTTADVYTTTLDALTISGSAQDLGNNLSRAQIRNLANDSEGWDYGLAGSADNFYVENIGLQTGPNTIQVTVYDEAGNQGSDSLILYKLGDSAGAVIIVAGHNETYSLQTNIYNAANNAYRVFRGAGFSENDIYYLAPTSQDPDGDGDNEVDATATAANLEYAITTWAAEGGRVGPGKPLYLYMMDHGLVEAFCTNGCSSGSTASQNLHNWLSTLETNTGAEAINVIIEACHSGSFIDRVAEEAASISEAGRVVIASTGRTNNAYASPQGAYFSDAFFSCVVSSNSLKTCYNQAKAAVATTGVNQTPWLDDNGDGLSNPGDGTIAQNRYVTTSFGSFQPEIEYVSVTVEEGSGTLTARVTRGATAIDLVWAAVYPPSFQEPAFTTLDLGVPVLLLEADPEEEGLYTMTYPNGFVEEGIYRVVFYAQDRSDVHAQPRLKTWGGNQVYLPIVVKD